MDDFKNIVKTVNDIFPQGMILNSYAVAKLFREFYEQIKHGDDDHKKWLKDETEKFIKAHFGDI